MKLAVTLAFCFIIKIAIGNTVLQSTCQLDLETTVSKSLELLKNALERGECEPTCPDGWLYNQGSCYLFGNTLLTFEEAKSFCGQYGSHLVHINNSSENAFLKSFAGQMTPHNWWMNLVYSGGWKWFDDGSVLTFTDWGTNQPGGDGQEDCSFLFKSESFFWHDAPCVYSDTYPLCEKENN